MKLNCKALILLLIIVLNQTVSSITHSKRMKSSLHTRRRSHRMSTSGKVQAKANTKFLPLIIAAVILALYITQKVMDHYTLKLNEERLKLMKHQHEMNQNAIVYMKKMEMEHCSRAKIFLAINRYLKYTNQLNYIFKSNLAEVMTNQEDQDKEKDKEIILKFKQVHESVQQRSFEVIERMELYVNKVCNQKSIYGLLEEEDTILEHKITELKTKISENSGSIFDGVFNKIKGIVQGAVQAPIKLKDTFKKLSVGNWDSETSLKVSQVTSVMDNYKTLDKTYKSFKGELEENKQTGAILAFESISTLFTALEQVTKTVSKFVTVTQLIAKLFNLLAVLMKWASAFISWRNAKKHRKEAETDEAYDKLIQATKAVLLAVLEMIFAPIVDLMAQAIDSIISGIKVIKAKNDLKKQILDGNIYRRLRQNAIRTSERYNSYNMCQLSADTLINAHILMEESGLSEKDEKEKLAKLQVNKELEVQNLQKDHYESLIKNSPGVKESLEKDLTALCRENLQLCARSLNIPLADTPTLKQSDALLAGIQVELKKKAIYGPYSDITIANYESEVHILIQLGYEPIDLNFDSSLTFPKLFGCRKCNNRVVINAYIVENHSSLNIKTDEKCNRYFNADVCLTSVSQTIRLNSKKQLIFETVDITQVKSNFYPAVIRIFTDGGNELQKFSLKTGIYNELTGNYYYCSFEEIKNQKFKFCEGENFYAGFEIDEKKANIIRLDYSYTERNKNQEMSFMEHKANLALFEFGRVFGANYLSFVLANNTSEKAVLREYKFGNYPRKHHHHHHHHHHSEYNDSTENEIISYFFDLKDKSVKPVTDQISVDPLKYNWLSLKSEENKMISFFKKYFNDASVKEIATYRSHSKDSPSVEHSEYNLFSMSPFSIPAHTDINKEVVNISKLCKTMINNCFTTESTIDESTDLSELGGPMWSSLITSERDPQIVQPDVTKCKLFEDDDYTICQMDTVMDDNCLFSFQGTNPRYPKCYKSGTHRFKLEDSTTYVVLIKKYIFEKISSYSSIFNKYVLGKNRFIHSDFNHELSEHTWFLATQYSVRDKLFPFYNIKGGRKESLYTTNFKLQTRGYEDYSIDDLEDRVPHNSSIFVRRKFRLSTTGNKMYRKVYVENGDIKEELESYGPGIKKYYYIQFTDIENLDEYYEANYRDASIIGFEKISEIKRRDGMRIIVWVLVDYRLTINLKDKLNFDVKKGTTIEKGICDKNILKEKPIPLTLGNEGVIKDFYLYKSGTNLNNDYNPCSYEGTGSNAPVLYDDYEPDDPDAPSFDIRQRTMTFLWVYFCQMRGKRSNERGFISYKKPPVIIEDSAVEAFYTLFRGYRCDPNVDLPDNITYDLGAGLGNTYRLCVHFTRKQDDPGIKNFYVYPKNNNMNCDTENKHLSVFITDDNYECICNDLNAGRTGPSVYICYEKGTN